MPEYPLKVTVERLRRPRPGASFWHTGGEKVLYTTDPGAERARALGLAADVVPLGNGLDWRRCSRTCTTSAGVGRLMVEGGGLSTPSSSARASPTNSSWSSPPSSWATRAPRLFGPGGYQGGRLRLLESRQIEDVVLMRYEPTAPGTGR